MAKKPTAADAQLILQLYDFRREAEMRKARNWWGGSFWPQNADEYVRIAANFSAPENAWLRQVLGYWDMAASLVLRGALNEDLFFDCGGEMWFVFSKVSPFLKEIRTKTNSPKLLVHVEELAKRTKQGRERLKIMEARAEAQRKALAGAAKSS
jgi:hypothetical protein